MPLSSYSRAHNSCKNNLTIYYNKHNEMPCKRQQAKAKNYGSILSQKMYRNKEKTKRNGTFSQALSSAQLRKQAYAAAAAVGILLLGHNIQNKY